MMRFLLGFITAFVVLVIGVGAYLRLGLAPVATSAPPLPFERLVTKTALNARIDKEAPVSVPIKATPEAYMAGARTYRTHCAVCHGLPGEEPTAIAKGEFPKPPALFKGKGVTDDPAGETYWKVANGIRLTGMPGFTGSLTTDQMWQVSLLLANADKVPADVNDELMKPLAP
jgi:mono/diheme cytochrome c family protein